MFGDYFAQMAADGFTAAMEVLCECVGRILESDACSQNKVFKIAENVGYEYPTYILLAV